METKLMTINLDQTRKAQYKFVIAGAVITIMFFFIGWVILPILNFLFNSTKEASDLKAALIKPSFIPDTSSIQNIVFGDLFLTAWDLNNRSPRFYNKFSHTAWNETKFDHTLSLSDMTWASANTPYYFKPAVIGGNAYVSGDNLALSPAMFAYYYANEQNNIAMGDIRIVSVGATNELAEKIDTQASLLDWAVRLTSLTTQVKKHTMDYMTEHLLRKNGHELHKFEVPKDRQWEEDFYYSDVRLDKLKDEAQSMIFSERNQIEQVLTTIVGEKFAASKPATCVSTK